MVQPAQAGKGTLLQERPEKISPLALFMQNIQETLIQTSNVYLPDLENTSTQTVKHITKHTVS